MACSVRKHTRTINGKRVKVTKHSRKTPVVSGLKVNSSNYVPKSLPKKEKPSKKDIFTPPPQVKKNIDKIDELAINTFGEGIMRKDEIVYNFGRGRISIYATIQRDLADVRSFYEKERELRSELNTKLTDFKAKVKKFAKVTWDKPDISSSSDIFLKKITAKIYISGKIVGSQYIAYMVDDNTGRKVKLGTYESKSKADVEQTGLYGFSSSYRHVEKDWEIFYWTKSGSNFTYKTFNNEDEMIKYKRKLRYKIVEKTF